RFTNAGNGYAVNDTINLGNGTTLRVTSVNAGAITGYAVQAQGQWTGVLPTSFNQLSSSGAGVGAVFDQPTWADAGLLYGGQSVRPSKLESAFLRQLTQSQPNQIDYPLELLQSREDYNLIALKQLQSFPGYVFCDSEWPLAKIFPWPVPQANIYGVFVTVRAQ